MNIISEILPLVSRFVTAVESIATSLATSAKVVAPLARVMDKHGHIINAAVDKLPAWTALVINDNGGEEGHRWMAALALAENEAQATCAINGLMACVEADTRKKQQAADNKLSLDKALQDIQYTSGTSERKEALVKLAKELQSFSENIGVRLDHDIRNVVQKALDKSFSS